MWSCPVRVRPPCQLDMTVAARTNSRWRPKWGRLGGSTVRPDQERLLGQLELELRIDVLRGRVLGARAFCPKEILGNIWEGKRTLMLVHTSRECTADERDRLRRVFSVAREQRTERDVEWVFRLFEGSASIDLRAPPCGRWSRRRWTSSTSPTAMCRPRRIATSFGP
jgi:hypothetical protein